MAASISFGALLVCVACRAPWIWRCWTPLLRLPVVWAIGTFGAWSILAVTWSPDPAQGLDELRALRILLLPGAIWPVARIAGPLIGAVLAGVALQNGAQVVELLTTETRPGAGAVRRYGGELHPIATGAWCAAAVLWHGWAAVRHPRTRWLAISGLGVAGVGLLLTGSRGPWLAALVAGCLLPLALALRPPRTPRAAAVLLGAALLAAAGAWIVAGGAIEQRIDQAIREARAATEKDHHWTSIGLRIGQWDWAIDLAGERPVTGHGTGAFRTILSGRPSYEAAIETARRHAERTIDDPERAENEARRRAGAMDRAHPHSSYLHVLVVQGAVGLLAFLAVLAATMTALWPRPGRHAFAGAGPLVLLAWMILAQFDTIHLSGSPMGLLGVLMADALAATARPGGAADGTAPEGGHDA